MGFGAMSVSESSLSEELDSLLLSDSEDEKPFILEEPAITSTFSAAGFLFLRRQEVT